ncbi:DNA-binding transcriptional LysR family regulator [Haloactinopolyspora alba]|uniref:DNA-binding transcriptional LysR family regulator n=1 Tax=Haloactinopolyspora alba TaxID=648780 RepID=A0A2P8E2E3_9ACTN|nr:LysR family transcriptional regulator [Haloactinopolyspora alba]PSL03634.1 DNA-binding transcriptional LysR family regulator [Haloactinopolyspora alba]
MNTGPSADGYRLEWLTSFLAVVDHGGFAAAAEHTFRSQPRVSTHVADLERRLGAVLFDRRERPVRLTEAGVAFLAHARAIQRELEAGVSAVQSVLGLLRGHVRVACFPSAAAAMMPRAIIEFERLHANITVSLVEGDTLNIGEALYAGEAELALRPVNPPAREHSLEWHVLWEEPLVAVVARDDELATAERLTLFELSRRPLITIGSGQEHQEHAFEVHTALADAGLSPRIPVQTNQPQTLVAMARAGLGVGITNLLAASVSDTEGVVVVPLRDVVPHREVGVFWDTSRPMQPATRAFLDLLLQMPVPEPVELYQRRELTGPGCGR